MNNSYYYYAILESRWIPNNPADAFLPMVCTIIANKRLAKVNAEMLANISKSELGYEIPYFIIVNCISKLARDGIIKISNYSDVEYDVQDIPNSLIISKNDIENFNQSFKSILQGYVDFYKVKEITIETAEITFNDFLTKYAIDLFSKEFSEDGFEDDEGFLYFFVEYVKSIKDDKELFPCLLKICEGYIIKNFIINENIDISPSKSDKLNVFLDTSVVFRLLGYYGKYLEEQYKYLVLYWQSIGASFYIYNHTKGEIVSILLAAAHRIDNQAYEYTREFDVLLYFRRIKSSSADIYSHIDDLDERLSNLGIGAFPHNQTIIDPLYCEDTQLIQKRIVDVYSEMGKTCKESTIAKDVDSTVYTYAIRHNNAVTRISDLTAVFITTNSGFVKAIKEYHQTRYGETLSPVFKDTSIGLIILSSDANSVKMFLSKNLVAYCYSAYNITEPVRAKLMAALEKQKITAGISDTRFQAIKNYTYLDDLLNEYTWGGSRELPEGSISSFDALIRDEYAKEVTKIKDNELEAQKNVYESRIGKLNEEASRKLEEEKETNAIRNANNANNDYRLAQIGIKIVLNVFFVLVALFFVYYSFTNFFVDNLIVAGIAYGIGAIIPFALTIINILSKGKTLSTWLLSLFRKKLVKKYFLHDGFQFDSRICKQKNNRRGT